MRSDAKESALKRSDLTRYRRIHFATHAFLDERVPARSGIALSLDDPGEDGMLRMSEILGLRLNAELVVLSACRTGLGKVVRGEGMVGLTRAFQQAGAERVAVSLWEVSDAPTADLMRAFYARIRDGLSPAEALASAKRVFLAGRPAAYASPYYWAAFVLNGRR